MYMQNFTACIYAHNYIWSVTLVLGVIEGSGIVLLLSLCETGARMSLPLVMHTPGREGATILMQNIFEINKDFPE